mgnify:CR=1 FL=1
MKKLFSFFLVFAFAIISFYSQNVSAQSSRLDIEEIVVTGTKRDIGQQDAAIAVSAITEQAFQNTFANDPRALSTLVPNLTLTLQPGFNAVSGGIRGTGSVSILVTEDPSVAFLVDDFGINHVQAQFVEMFDIEQIEVYRGPQGSRMGANSLAGLVYVKTNDPIDSFFAKADLILGDYGRKDIGAVLNVPISSDLKYRMSLKKEDSDGFRKNIYLKRSDTSKKDERSYRFKLDWDLSDISSLDFVYFSNDFDNPADIWTIDGSLNTLSDRPGMDSQNSKALGLNYILNAPTNKINLLYSKTNTDVVFSYDADWGNSLSHAPFTYDYFSETFRKRDTENFEIRLLSEDVDFSSRNFNWIVGYSVFKIKESNNKFDDGAYGDPFDGYDTFFSESFFSSNYSSKSNSLFGNLDYFLSSSLKLSFGMRWEDWDAGYSDSNKESFNPVDKMNGGKISLTKTTTEDLTFFVSAAKGYKQGGFNLGTGLSASSFSNSINYQPESLINYEFGLNGYIDYLDTYLDFVVFLSDRKDQQVLISTQVDPQDPNTFLYLTRNAAEGNNYGAELSIKKDLSDQINLFFDLGLLETEITHYSSRPDLEGREQAHAPSYSFSTGMSWKLSQGLEFILDLTGKSDFYYSDSHDNKSDNYILTNINLSYSINKVKYNFWVKNLFDEYYSLRGFFFGNEPPNFEDKLYERHGDPRNLGLSIQYVF